MIMIMTMIVIMIIIVIVIIISVMMMAIMMVHHCYHYFIIFSFTYFSFKATVVRRIYVALNLRGRGRLIPFKVLSRKPIAKASRHLCTQNFYLEFISNCV